jgi:hypothetical protein
VTYIATSCRLLSLEWKDEERQRSQRCTGEEERRRRAGEKSMHKCATSDGFFLLYPFFFLFSFLGSLFFFREGAPSRGCGCSSGYVAVTCEYSRRGNAAALGARGRCPMFMHAISARFFGILNRGRDDTDEWSIFGLPIYPRDKIFGRTFSSLFSASLIISGYSPRARFKDRIIVCPH